MRKFILIMAVILLAACSKQDECDVLLGNEFKVSTSAAPFDNIVCGFVLTGVLYHDGLGATPEIGDTVFSNHDLGLEYDSNEMYHKMEGNKVFKTDDNGIVIEIINCN